MRIPGYRLERKIGQGGMAVVYLAIQESLDRPVALKVLNPVFSDTPEFSQRFLNEGRILAALNHANIITIHDIGITDDLHFISMEYVDGSDLKQRMRQGLNLKSALDYVETIGSCLEFAHGRHIVHRDIKPANILFRQDGTLLLTDFGIAKQLNSNKDITCAGATVGSPSYLSPEQAQGLEVDGRSDLYSVGVILYEMLTGKKPFAGKNDLETIVCHLNDPVPRLPEQLARFQALIDKLLAKRADDRFADAGALLASVRALRSAPAAVAQVTPAASTRTLPACKSTPKAAAAPPPKRSARISWAAGLCAFAALAAGAMIATGSRQRPATSLVDLGAPSPHTQSSSLSPSELPGSGPPRVMATTALTTERDRDSLSIPEQVPVPDRASPPVVDAAAPADIVALASADAEHQPGLSAPPSFDPPAPVETIDRNAHIDPDPGLDEMIRRAELALERFRLTRPPGDNAYEYYLAVLQRDPHNIEARGGFERIAGQFEVLVQRAMARNDRELARSYVSAGLGVYPESQALVALERQLGLQQQLTQKEQPTPVTRASRTTEDGSRDRRRRTDSAARERARRSGGRLRDNVVGESPTKLIERVKGFFD